MATVLYGILLLLSYILFLTAVRASVFDGVLDDTEACKAVCDKTYPLHTYPKTENSVSCKRGCRLFAISEFMSDPSSTLNETRDICQKSCMESYIDEEEMYACKLGCNSQLPIAKLHQEEVENEPLHMHMLHPMMNMNIHQPMMRVHAIYSNFMDNFLQNMMSVKWSASVYVQQDDGKIVIVQSKPKITYEYSDPEPLKSEIHYEADNSVLEDDAPLLSVQDIDNEQSDWLACVSKKSGLPRWFLAGTIFLSALVFVFICLSTSATAPDVRIKSKQVNGKLDEPDFIKVAYAKNFMWIQPDEAGPLPIKLKTEKI